MPEINNEPTIPDCDVCNDMGYICEVCDRPDGECTCEDGPTLVPCPECPVD